MEDGNQKKQEGILNSEFRIQNEPLSVPFPIPDPQSAIRNPQSSIPLPPPWRVILRFDELDSTQNEAERRLAAGESMAGTILWAERQEAGRGRRDHAWISEPGGLYLTAGLPAPLPLTPADTGWTLLIAAWSAADTLRHEFGIETWIKWPNDLIVNGRKVGGLLGEFKATGAPERQILIGLGLNWRNRVDLPDSSMATAQPGSLVDSLPALSLEGREPFIQSWLARLNLWRQRLERDYNGTLKRLRSQSEAMLWRKGEAVRFKHTEHGPVEGRLLGLGVGGAARVEPSPGELAEVHCGWQTEGWEGR